MFSCGDFLALMGGTMLPEIEVTHRPEYDAQAQTEKLRVGQACILHTRKDRRAEANLLPCLTAALLFHKFHGAAASAAGASYGNSRRETRGCGRGPRPDQPDDPGARRQD